MPNGFHNDASIDVIYHRHTEHGQTQFRTRRHNQGFVSVHLEHHGGYVYEPHWDTLDLYPFVQTRRFRPTRAEMGELAEELVKKLVDLQTSNAYSKVLAQRASGIVFLYNWCILLGSYHVYMRTDDRSFELIVPPIGSRTNDELLRYFKIEPEFDHVARDTNVHAVGGLQFHTPSECVYDFDAVDEVIASTVPLHKHPEWSEIAKLPLDSIESAGRILTAMRNEAIAHGSDHAVIRFRNEIRAAKRAKTKPVDESAPIYNIPSGELEIIKGPLVGKRYWIPASCSIGRNTDCNIILDDDSVSRRHAIIMMTHEGYVISDLGSTSGTFVNESRRFRHVLEDGDRIRLGTVVLAFTHSEERSQERRE